MKSEAWFFGITGKCVLRAIGAVIAVLICTFAWAQSELQSSVPDSGAYEGQSEASRYPRNAGTPWPAVDELGRALPTIAEVGPPRPDRFAGIFYFLWLGQHDLTDKQPFVVT